MEVAVEVAVVVAVPEINASRNGDIDTLRQLLRTKSLRKDDKALVLMAACQ